MYAQEEFMVIDDDITHDSCDDMPTRNHLIRRVYSRSYPSPCPLLPRKLHTPHRTANVITHRGKDGTAVTSLCAYVYRAKIKRGLLYQYA